MEKRPPFFLDKFFRRNPQTSESSDERGWGNLTDDTSLNGWGSFTGSSSRSSTNGWVDEPHEKHYNGWGSGSSSSSKFTAPKASSNGWMTEPPKDGYNGWGSGSSGKSTTPKANSNGWMVEPPNDGYNGWGSGSAITEPPKHEHNGRGSGSDTCLGTAEPPKDEYHGWGLCLSGKCTTPWGSGSAGKYTTSIASSTTWITNLSDSDTIQKSEIDNDPNSIFDSRRVNDDSWADPLPVPSAPPLPNESLIFYEHHAGNVSNNRSFDFIAPVDFFEKSKGKDVDARGSTCVVCWDALIEGACVPCGHMAGCMACLYKINSKQGTCPVCRAKIDKVMWIYAI